MTLATRRIIFWSLVVAFLIITPLILLYSMGYVFDWQKRTFVKTGSFYFKTSPTGAKIYFVQSTKQGSATNSYINDNYKGKTNKYIKRLLPKEYNVIIKKDGFHVWEKRLKIESQIVTEARNILLVPQNPGLETIIDNLSNLSPDFSLSEFLLANEQKEQLKLASTTANKILKTNSYQWLGDAIYYLQKPDNILYRSDLNGFNQAQIALNPLSNDAYRILISPNQYFVAVLNKNGQLYLFNPDKRIFEKLAENIKNAELSPDNKKLLYFTDSEIFVIYLEKILIQPYKKSGQKELVTRFSEKINSAIWYPEDNEHIIFIVGDTIKIIELDDRDKRNVVDVVKMKTFSASLWDKPQIAYNTKERKLYFINNNKLYSIVIMSGGLW